jgi:hypothetical protein
MKKLPLAVFAWVFALSVMAQSTNAPTFVKGTLDIKYNTRQSDKPVKGVKDRYTVNVNVCNSALFHGTITDQPQIIEGWISKSVTQPRLVDYDLALDVVNPKNPAQIRNVGRLFGNVPIASDGTYKYDAGTLSVDVLPSGTAPGFSSKFTGSAIGKPMGRPANWLDTFKGNAVSITRNVGGKTTTVVLKKYDRMQFQNVVLGAGPMQAYPQVTVNGEMLYDYDKNCWFFNNVSLMYGRNRDALTGTIRWVESPQRKTNGEGEYQFDVRVNEPPPSESAAFAAPTDESAFFESDASVPALAGTMKYKDTVRQNPNAEPTTLSSGVTIDLTGNNLSKQQVMALTKVIIFAAVVPMNAD